MPSSRFLSVACALGPLAVARPAAPQSTSPSPVWRFGVGPGLSSFATQGSTPRSGPGLRRDRYELPILVHRVDGYAAYSSGLQDLGPDPTRWIQRALELGALWPPLEVTNRRIHADLSLGLGRTYVWAYSGHKAAWVPVLLVFGTGGYACVPTSNGDTCPPGPTYNGRAWGVTPSVAGTFGASRGAFVGLRLAGRHLWVHATDTPSFVREYEPLLNVGMTFGSTTPDPAGRRAGQRIGRVVSVGRMACLFIGGEAGAQRTAIGPPGATSVTWLRRPGTQCLDDALRPHGVWAPGHLPTLSSYEGRSGRRHTRLPTATRLRPRTWHGSYARDRAADRRVRTRRRPPAGVRRLLHEGAGALRTPDRPCSCLTPQPPLVSSAHGRAGFLSEQMDGDG